MNAVDTNVLVYHVDHAEPVKQRKADHLLSQLVGAPEPTVLLWQVVGEFLNCMIRWEFAQRIERADTERYLSQYLSTFQLTIPVPNVLSRSLDLTSRFSLSHWDGMLIAACVEAGVGTLYSEDMDDGANYDGVTVVDPFA